MKTPGRLYRRTGMLSRPLSRVQIGTFDQGGAAFYNDDDIISVKIIHGTESPQPGLTPSRVEIHLKGDLPRLNGSSLYIFGPATTALETPNEPTPAWRFSGRVTTQTNYYHPSKPTTLIQGASYSSIATGSNVVMPVGTGWGLRDVIETIVAKLERLSYDEIRYVNPYIDNSDKLNETDWDMTVGQALNKFLFDIGIHCFVMRQGYLKFRTMDRLRQEVEECAAGPGGPAIYPLERRQVLAPMDLEQTTENSNIGVKLKRRNSAGTVIDGVWTFGEGWQDSGNTTVTEWSEYDWSHIRFATEQYRWGINAESHRLFRTSFRSPTVKVDLLSLLNGDTAWDEHSKYRDWEMAKALLRVETGDCLPFGRDWEPRYRGVKIVTRIEEVVTPDEWSLTFTVHPPQIMTGRYGVAADPEPTFTSYIWDRYDAGFNTFPGYTFADMAPWTFDQYRDLG